MVTIKARASCGLGAVVVLVTLSIGAGAADEKAKADLIYQTNRNAACQARPASCTAN